MPSLAGPKRPQDRVALSDMKDTFQKALTAPVKDRGYELSGDALNSRSHLRHQRRLTKDEAWRGRDRGNHILHEYIQSICDGRGGTCRKEGC